MKVECVHSSRDDDSRGTGQVVRVFVSSFSFCSSSFSFFFLFFF
jgi:hypothetical protein